MVSGFTIVLVAIDPDRQVIGAIHTAPPFHILMRIRDAPKSELYSTAAVVRQITGIAVLPSQRRTGVGSALMRYTEALSWRAGCRLLYGQFDIDLALKKFFTSCGFKTLLPREGIKFTPYGSNVGIMPRPGAMFFASHYETSTDPEWTGDHRNR